MKKHIILASALLLAGVTTLAQNPTTEAPQNNAAAAAANSGDSLINKTKKSLEDLVSNLSQLQELYSDYDKSLQLSLVAKPKTDAPLRDTTENNIYRKKYPQVSSSLHFYWGFHNWGHSTLSGPVSANHADALRTSFSSYQLEYRADIALSRRWQLSVGLGWESDCYKFRDNYVRPISGFDAHDMWAGDAETIETYEHFSGDLANPIYWETRLITRYINVPIRLGYNFKFGDCSVGLSVIPGFNYNGKNTGMKYLMEMGDKEYERIDDCMDESLETFKCDIRFDVETDFIGFFVQIATVPVVGGTHALYPFKIGFFL